MEVTEMKMLKALAEFEYPETWGITTNLDHLTKYNSGDVYQFFPLQMFIHDIMQVYKCANNGTDSDSILEKLKKCEEDIALIEEKHHPEISLNVIRHIFETMKIYVNVKYDKFEDNSGEFESQLQQVTSFNDSDKKDKATLEACKSIGWTKFDIERSIYFIKEARKHNPDCDLWHFILARELRRQRRDENIRSKPSELEMDCYEQAYAIDKNPLCGIFYAQAHKEDGNYEKARLMYNAIYENGVDEIDILLRLANGFIFYKNFQRAKECLDRVEVTNPTHSLYLHYRGMLFMKKGQFKEAVPFLKDAIDEKKLGVEKHYLFCIVRADPSFDAENYVLGMIDKYKNFPVKDKQHLQLELAMCYEKNGDFAKAMECFVNAIEMGRNSSTLTRFDCCVNPDRRGINVYDFLKRELLPKLNQTDRNIDEAADRLKNLLIRRN